MTTMLRFATLNLHDYAGGAHDRTGELIQALHADVVAVQELMVDNQLPEYPHMHRDLIGSLISGLADASGMTTRVPEDYPYRHGWYSAFATGRGRHHVGLLWSRNLTPVPGTYRAYETDLWHSLVKIQLDVGAAQPIQVASYHAAPFDGGRRTADARRVVGALTRPTPAPPTLVGADWNGLAAERVHRDGAWTYYDPDPYTSQDWYPDLIYQTHHQLGDDGKPARWWADRDAAEALMLGGLTDAAAALDTPWQPTVGHHPADPFPARRIDAVRVSRHLLPALRDHTVIHDPIQGAPGIGLIDPTLVSDHLPVVVDIDLDAITTDPPRTRH